MFNKNRLLILTGSIALIFSSGALLTKHDEVLLEPIVQGIFGFVTVFMAGAGVTAYRRKRKGRGSFFTFVTLFLIMVILLNNTMTIAGLLPVAALYIGVPIGIMAMVAQRFNKDDWYKKIE
ncbi:hypothetical protein [Halobacillus litoralis]|uniref:hypothetical protein n=1 Tax=Halobacillus litoralis TaxID=45668 RepID=UPI0024911BCC|nr:hypothetical protein [Halobacillus litoralis]